ncbi:MULTISPECIES: hypothetical protein [unclassified Caulobacter]|jgi:hypothetical protein|uniref:hypothetical protein n=1 Tax=unclassified Caulobacter TaxID=2648921 RepID=UPI0006F99251|nr:MULTISPECIES: hypothetical protein [unclassified Caulobacter]KQV56090.1 hypothetical protein ASC62_19510 [Caulobacter sp. Root342]KQV70735.1 hypothetical protein ASC70_03745 [Caulobacter sp. Root343]
MRLTHLLAVSAALSMVALPALAAGKAGNPASKLSLAAASGIAPSAGAAATSTTVVVGVAVAAVVAGALALSKHDSKAASS